MPPPPQEAGFSLSPATGGQALPRPSTYSGTVPHLRTDCRGFLFKRRLECRQGDSRVPAHSTPRSPTPSGPGLQAEQCEAVEQHLPSKRGELSSHILPSKASPESSPHRDHMYGLVIRLGKMDSRALTSAVLSLETSVLPGTDKPPLRCTSPSIESTTQSPGRAYRIQP